MLLFNQQQAPSTTLACLRDIIAGQRSAEVVPLSGLWGFPIVRACLGELDACDQTRKRSVLVVTGSKSRCVLSVLTIRRVVTTQDGND